MHFVIKNRFPIIDRERKFHSSLNIYGVVIYFQDVSDDEIIADGELISALSTDPCSQTDLVPVTSQTLCLLPHRPCACYLTDLVPVTSQFAYM